MFTLHVNAYVLITPPPWSIPRLSQPPLQRRPSVVTPGGPIVNPLIIPCVSLLFFCLARMQKKAHFGRPFL